MRPREPRRRRPIRIDEPARGRERLAAPVGRVSAAGFAVDAFQVAFRVPNLLRDLFAEGAMSAAFVPTLTKAQQDGGPEAAMRLANLVINFLLVVVSGLCLIGILTAPWIVAFLAPGFGAIAGKLALTTLMTQIMTPFLLLVSV